MKTIKVLPYSENWINEFRLERELLLNSISLNEMLVHHIGSTSVIGLAAKPIIDILLEVEDVRLLDQLSTQFERLGYECKGELGISGRRYFRKGGDQRTHQIHAFNKGSHGATRHLAFRDYLMANSDIAKEYESVKYQAASQCNDDISVYCDLKNDFVSRHEKLAVKWAELNTFASRA